MKKILIAILIIMFGSQVFATTYNIGPGQTYTTFTALVAAITLTSDDIVDGGGNTFTETWTPDGSGSSGHEIILRNAIVNPSSGASIFINAKNYIKIQNITGTGVSGGVNISANSSYITVEDSTITASNGTCIQVSANNNLNSHHIIIQNNTLRNSSANGVWLNFGDADVGEGGIIYSVDILNNQIYGNAGRGVRLSSADNTNEKGYDIYINGNTIYDNDINGITYQSLDNTSGENKVSNNIIYENGVSNTLGGIHISYVANPTVEDNIVYNNHTNGIDGRGIYFDTSTTDFICRRNLVYGHDDNSTPPNQSSGIAVTAASTGSIYYNISYLNDAGISIGGASTGILIYHNTVFNNLDRGISLQNTVDSSEVTIKNNIIYGNITYGLYDDDAVHDPTSDYNSYFENGTDTYQISSIGANSITTDPKITPSGKIQGDSPCIDAGIWIAGINDQGYIDLFKKGLYRLPNIGADEGAGIPRQPQLLRIGR